VDKTVVLVAATTPPNREPDLLAVGLCDEIRSRPGQMLLAEDRVLDPREVDPLLAAMDPATPCALVLISRSESNEARADHWLDEYPHLVVAMLPIGDDAVVIHRLDPRLKQVVDAVHDLVEKGGRLSSEGSRQLRLPVPANEIESDAVTPDEARKEANVLELDEDDVVGGELPALPPPRRLLEAANAWAHVLLKKAASRLFGENGHGIAFTRVQVVDWLDERGPRAPLIQDDQDTAAAEAAMCEALEEALSVPGGPAEPLAIIHDALDLDPLEFRMLVLALCPELDPRHQHWISLLMMDDPARRVGTMALYAELIGVPSDMVVDVVRSRRLARWRLLEGTAGALPGGDAPLRLDPPLRAWLLGDPSGLEVADLALRRVLREHPWPGSTLVEDEERAKHLVESLRGGEWLLLADDGGPAAWRALLEAGAAACTRAPIRAGLATVTSLDPVDSAEIGIRLARLARLSGRPLLVDVAEVERGQPQDQALGALLQALGAGGATGAIVTTDPARIARLFAGQDYRMENEMPSAPARLAALASAAEKAGAQFTFEALESLANLYPLQIDGIEQAMRLARARPAGANAEAQRSRFLTACKEVSAEGASGLAHRIEPMFDLGDIILPPDRKGQLEEIVDNVRFAPKVLEGWRFRDQLPYGLGVTALFHGPSGTGKTMASMAIAKTLGVQLLRIDLSRVVSKYIGDTEKNIDRIFLEAQGSGAGLLIDEAEGLLARRGEVKDAHDRYANLEVAYLLQRMEAFEGLCILTTNLRQNIDSAFLRRLRFIVEFPRPDAAAREEIWRRCLPMDSHALDNATFRTLARRIELSGGSIRQITLRAAFLAAAAGTRISSAHVAHAARAEFAKLGLPPVELDLAERAAA